MSSETHQKLQEMGKWESKHSNIPKLEISRSHTPLPVNTELNTKLEISCNHPLNFGAIHAVSNRSGAPANVEAFGYIPAMPQEVADGTSAQLLWRSGERCSSGCVQSWMKPICGVSQQFGYTTVREYLGPCLGYFGMICPDGTAGSHHIPVMVAHLRV